MSLFQPSVKKLIEHQDKSGLRQLLSKNPLLANKGITIPFDILCRKKAHPLHRICDAVFAGKMPEGEALKIAAVLLENGAHIDGDKAKGEGTPLLAAASLHAEQLGVFYIDQGADIHYTYEKDGASALHWAAFCGRDGLVNKLIDAGAIIDEADGRFKSTPLGWAIHSLQSDDSLNKHNQINCIKLLLEAGADSAKLDKTKKEYLLSLPFDTEVL